MLARPDDADTDAGPRRAAACTERLCVVTREVKPIDEMIRFVVGPDLAVVPDLKRKLPGRGVWVSARRDIVAAAAKRRALGRAFRADVKAAAALLAGRANDTGLARWLILARFRMGDPDRQGGRQPNLEAPRLGSE